MQDKEGVLKAIWRNDGYFLPQVSKEGKAWNRYNEEKINCRK